MLPIEFTVPGAPLSSQTHNRARLQGWKLSVATAAAAAWPPGEAPYGGAVRVVVVYYYDTRPADVDNFHKPIQDALSGVIYVDDPQVDDAAPSKRNINGRFRVRGMSRVLADAFVEGQEFVYVRVEVAPDPADLI